MRETQTFQQRPSLDEPRSPHSNMDFIEPRFPTSLERNPHKSSVIEWLYVSPDRPPDLLPGSFEPLAASCVSGIRWPQLERQPDHIVKLVYSTVQLVHQFWLSPQLCASPFWFYFVVLSFEIKTLSGLQNLNELLPSSSCWKLEVHRKVSRHLNWFNRTRFVRLMSLLFRGFRLQCVCHDFIWYNAVQKHRGSHSEWHNPLAKLQEAWSSNNLN